MGHIFRKAQVVLAWLGPSQAYAGVAFRILRDLGKGRLPGKELSNKVQALLEELLGSLFDIPFWGRVWIIQELAKPKRVTLICGEFEAELGTLVRATRRMSLRKVLCARTQAAIAA